VAAHAGIAYVNLSELQKYLPRAVPYSENFNASQSAEGHRHLIHNILHATKGLGQIARVAERVDHAGFRPRIANETAALEDGCADLVIAALHIAIKHGFDLEAAVVAQLDRVNGPEWKP
jgi:hypothetical protein